MNGVIFYEPHEVDSNRAFIDDIIQTAKRRNLPMTLITRVEDVPPNATFLFNRARSTDVTKQLATCGVPLVNRASVHALANDKYEATAFVRSLGIPTIPTVSVTRREDVPWRPAVLKTRSGRGGTDVHLCETDEQLDRVLSMRGDWIAQPFIPSHATDVRTFVIGDRARFSVKRTGVDSFKSNYTLGGRIEPYELSASERQQIETIARALESDYVGIDMLLTEDGLRFNEIEDPVGARSLYTLAPFSLADALVTYWLRRFRTD